METVLLVAMVLSAPVLSFIVLLLVLAVIGFVFQVMFTWLNNAWDAVKARIKWLFTKKYTAFEKRDN